MFFIHFPFAFIIFFLLMCVLVFTHIIISARLALLLCQFCSKSSFFIKNEHKSSEKCNRNQRWMNDLRHPENKMRIFARHKINRYRIMECRRDFVLLSLRRLSPKYYFSFVPFHFQFHFGVWFVFCAFTSMITIIMLWIGWESRVNALALYKTNIRWYVR